MKAFKCVEEKCPVDIVLVDGENLRRTKLTCPFCDRSLTKTVTVDLPWKMNEKLRGEETVRLVEKGDE